MQAGRELDALIAEKVMGWKVEPCEINHWGAPAKGFNATRPDDVKIWTAYGIHTLNNEILPSYSTDIAAAWQVVGKITELKRDGLGWFDVRYCNNQYQATFKTGAYYEAIDHVTADTAPHAICLAALKVIDPSQFERP